MKCPQCSYPNPQGVAYCQMCYEVFNRSAADRYIHAQKRARLKRGEPDPSPPPAASENPGATYTPVDRILSESLPKIDWGAFLKRWVGRLQNIARPHAREIGLGTAFVSLVLLVMYFTSPAKRLQMFGDRMGYTFPPPKTSVAYLVSFHTELKSWSERD